MLSLRDPADETNDLGRKGIAIKHVQATFRSLLRQLQQDVKINTRPSILAPLVGSSYMLNEPRRHKLVHYGERLWTQMQKTLSVKAKAMVDAEKMDGRTENENVREEETQKLARAEKNREWGRLAKERNERSKLEVERASVSEHKEVIPAVEEDVGMQAAGIDDERRSMSYTPAEETVETKKL